jgi:ABC-type antimicrobial peptide transport system permease subunit
MHDASRLTSQALLRSWRNKRARAIATLASAVIGITMVTMVVGVVTSILTAIDSGTGLSALHADVVVGARSPAGLSPDIAAAVTDEANGSDDVAGTAAVSFANSRIAGDKTGVLAIVGLDGPASFLPGFSDGDAALAAPAADRALAVTQAWADRHDLSAGDSVELTSPGGTLSWTIEAVVHADVPNGGAIALTSQSAVLESFGRQGSDALLVDLTADADRSGTIARLEGITGGSAIVGSADDVIRPEHASFALVRQILAIVATVGLLTAATVLFVCWRLLIEDERDTIARLRLIGARPRTLALGAGRLFAGLTLVAVAIGVPLGLGAAAGMTLFARQVVNLTGLAASPQPPGLLAPAAAGVVAAVVMVTFAWLTGLRAFLRVPPIEAVRGVTASAPRHAPVVPLLLGGAALAAAAVLASRTLPAQLVGGSMVLTLAAAVALAMALPSIVGALVRRRGGFGRLAVGRELAAGTGKRTGTVAVLAIALILSIGLAGQAASLSNGLHSSVEAWTKGDLYVMPSEPGVNLRDEKFPADVPGQLERLDSVEEVVPFTFLPFKYEDRNVQIYAWDLAEQSPVVDLDVAEGLDDSELWPALGSGDVAVSSNFAWVHDLEVGDTVELPTASGTITPRIVALVDDYTFDTGIIFTGYDTYTTITGDDRVLDLIVQVADGATVAEARDDIRGELGGYPGLTVWTGAEMEEQLMGLFGQVLAIVQAMGLFCLALAVLLGVTSTVAAVASRQTSIALTRLVGASRRQASRQLIGESMAVGVMAWLIAFPIGLIAVRVLVRAVGSQSGTFPPVQMPWAVAAAMLVAALAAAALAVLLPSRRLLRSDIADAVTYE